jgi:hypothetical protein
MLNSQEPKSNPSPGPDPENVHSPIVGAVYACLITARRGKLGRLEQERRHQIFGPVRVTVGFFLSPGESTSVSGGLHFHN